MASICQKLSAEPLTLTSAIGCTSTDVPWYRMVPTALYSCSTGRYGTSIAQAGTHRISEMPLCVPQQLAWAVSYDEPCTRNWCQTLAVPVQRCIQK